MQSQGQVRGSVPSPERGGRLRAILKISGAALLVLATCGPAVFAEDDNPASFFRADRERMQQMQRASRPVVQRPTHLIRRAAPIKGGTLDLPPPAEPLPPDIPREGAPPQDTQTADAPAGAAPPAPQPERPGVQRPVETTFTIAVIGDSLAQMLGQGLTEAYADRPEIAVQRKARENTGLVRDDYFDWVKGVRDLLASSDKISAAVIMVGSNDRQQLRDGNVSVDLRSARWKEIYGDRVEAIAQAFKDRKVPLIWVGLPVMKSERFSADMVQLNEIIRERAGRAGAIFVDTWDAFLDDRGQFATYGPDVNGQFQKLRAGDGVHFTKPGARKLAHFVETEIKRLIDDAHPQVDPAVVTVDPRMTREPPPLPAAPVSPSEAQKNPADMLAALPALAPTPEVVIPVKPAAGAVVPLTGPVLAPGGELATKARRASASSDADALLDRALIQGRPLDPRPGRADDFTWPRR